MKKIVAFTGAGISAESGLQTFRDPGGLWEKYDPYKLASPQGWAENPSLVLEFYNLRRQKVREAEPNPAHLALVQLESKYDVTIITQNVDDLHERAGSNKILHLHGEIRKARSSGNEDLIYELGDKDIFIGDKCEEGFQLRPHIVWFGEAVPAIVEAAKIASTADIFIVIGSGLSVYPAASLIEYVDNKCKIYIIDKNIPDTRKRNQIIAIEKAASTGVPELVSILLS